MKTDLEEAFAGLEEAQAKAERRRAMSLSNIPIVIHTQFLFGGYVARSRVYTCRLCEEQRTECLGIFSREDHVAGGQRYTLAAQWPQKDNMRHEVERVEEPFCFKCVQELGFTVMEDLGERSYCPQAKLIESGINHSTGTKRIIPKSVREVLQKFTERPATRQALDVQEMLDELSDGTAYE